MQQFESFNHILGGNTQERVRKPIVYKYSKVVEPGAFDLFIGKLDLTVLNGKVVRIFKTKLSRYSDTAKKCNNSDAPETLLTQVTGTDYTFRKYSEGLISYIICLTVINATYIYYCRVNFCQKLKTYK